MENQHAQSNKPPTKKYERQFPKLSESEKVSFLEKFKHAVKMGAVKLAPGNEISSVRPKK